MSATQEHDPPEQPDEAVEGVSAETAVDAVLTASRLLVAVSARSFASVEHALTLPQFRTLVVLDRQDETNITQLGEHLAVAPSTALRMVERLVAIDMVERHASPANRREILVRLTDSGRTVVREVTARRRRELGDILASMDPGAQSDLVAALQAFTAAGEEPSVSGHLAAGASIDPVW